VIGKISKSEITVLLASQLRWNMPIGPVQALPEPGAFHNEVVKFEKCKSKI
jgi:hypothetical protein